MTADKDYSFEDAIKDAQQQGGEGALREKLLERLKENLAKAKIPTTVPETPEAMRTAVIEAIRAVYDPEISVNLYDLGLIYSLEISEESYVTIEMTLTAPTCPIAGELPITVEEAVKQVPGVTGATANLVWEPAWDKSRMSEAARLELGLI